METIVYNRLASSTQLAALVGERIYPVQPSPDIVLPFISYTRTSTSPVLSMSGPSGLEEHGLDVDCWAINEDECLAVLATVKDLLNGWRGGPVQGAFITSQSSQQEEAGYHGSQSYSVWLTDGYARSYSTSGSVGLSA